MDNKTLGKALASREQLEASKPVREQFKTEEAFEEALGRWMENQGRILALSKGSPQT